MDTSLVPGNPGPIESRHFGGMVRVVVVSFGYLHGAAPDAHVTIDLRKALYDPHVAPAMRELTGLYPAVRANVLGTPGAERILHGAALLVDALLAGHERRDGDLLVRVAFGCAGGRHRSVVLANELTRLLVAAGIGAEVSHRDILRPVVRRPGECGRGDA
jgi:RNase adapter protein RapZ